jgi:excisionase family DNA binding protein
MTRNDDTSEQLLDSTDIAQFLKINPKTLQSMARSGQIPAIRVGKLWRFLKSDIEKWLRSKVEKKK